MEVLGEKQSGTWAHLDAPQEGLGREALWANRALDPCLLHGPCASRPLRADVGAAEAPGNDAKSASKAAELDLRGWHGCSKPDTPEARISASQLRVV